MGIPAPSAPVSAAQTPPGMYATFPRRLNGLSVDSIVVILASVVIFALVPLLDALQPLPRIVLILWLIAMNLYEPVQVARFGGTIGHRALNLRVVDDRTGGNPSFWKALARVWVKVVLEVFSFMTMGVSRRHCALQDMLTRTTVQIRDPQRALPHHYVLEPAPPPSPRGI